MKRKQDFLDLFNGVEDRFVVEAMESRVPAPVRVPKKRLLLIAAILGVMLLLVGCVAVFLRLQDMSIGQATYTREWDDHGKQIEPTEKTVELFTFFGHGGSPAQLAAKEWYAFSSSYDPGPLTNEPNLPEIPDLYEYNYGCVTPEIVEKVDELAQKYDLKLLDTRFGIQTEQSDIALDALGISSLFRTEAQVEAGPVAGMIYPPGNFRFYISYTLSGEDAIWKTPVSGDYFYSRKDYFPLPYYQSFEEERFQQWDYTAADGTRLLLALSDQGYGYIVADRKDAIIGIHLSISVNAHLTEGVPVPTQAVLEALADSFDYRIQPNVADPASLEAKLAESNAALTAPQTEEVHTHPGFDAFFLDNAVLVRDLDYCFYDINGDGQEDLLLAGQEDGLISLILTPLENGTILEHRPWPLRLLEGGGLSDYSPDLSTDQFFIMKPVSEGCSMILKDNGVSIETGETLWHICREEDGWKNLSPKANNSGWDRTPMTEAQVREILEAYPPMDLPWRPAVQYPLTTGQTVAELLESRDAPLSDGELTEEYAKQAADVIACYGYTRYCLRDLNGDGVKDLLLSADSMADIDPVSTTYYWSAYTIRYGTLLKLKAHSFYLCEEDVLESYSWSGSQVGEGTQEEHVFCRLKDREMEILDSIIYLRATDSWVSGEDYSSISLEEVQAVMDKYPRIEQGMRPISELMDP